MMSMSKKLAHYYSFIFEIKFPTMCMYIINDQYNKQLVYQNYYWPWFIILL